MKRRRALRIALASLAAFVSVVAMFVVAPGTAQAAVICEKFGSTTVQGGRYVIQNNNWGDDTTQCITTTDQGFSITTASHNKPTNGAPGSYPSVYAGCHYANCSSGSGLPMQATSSQFNSIQTSVSYSYPASGSVYNASYDLWFDPTPRTDGQNTGAEIMIWLNRVGSIQPVGSQVGTVSLAGGTWDVWFGNIGWNVISYVRQSTASSINFAVNTFFTDAVNRGHAQRSWYLTSVQAGFEPWVNGTGLTVNNFSYSTTGGGTGGDTTPPGTPGTLSSSGATSNSVNLSWGASTDNVGVAGYDVLRAPGASGGSFSVVGTPSGTSFTNSSLSANTTYRYQVRARDAAGNTSNVGNTVTVTTQTGGDPGPGTGGCTVNASTQSSWSNGYVLQVTVANSGSSTMSGWSVPFSLPSGHQVTGFWGAGVSPATGSVTATNLGYNGSLAPNQSVSWGLQASRPNGNTQIPAFSTCNAS